MVFCSRYDGTARLDGKTAIVTGSNTGIGKLTVLDFVKRGSSNNTQKWKPEDGGWGLHLASTISEWILVITYCILILSFVPEFYDLEFEAPVVTFKNK